jgi:geranylgeranyl diphosphate synthase type I
MPDAMQNALRAEIERCRQLTDALLRDPACRPRIAPEHLRQAAYAYLERPAKRLRPALLLLCCSAVGGDERQALPAAAAVEVFHTWTLVHDDVIDNDILRRGQPTVHAAAAAWATAELGAEPEAAAAYGRDVAILAGDVLQAWATALLLDCVQRGVPERIVLGLATRMQTFLNHRLVEGEMLDVQFSYRPVEAISEEEVLTMLRLKTGVLLEYSAAAGAAIGLQRLPGESSVVDALGDFAALCGVAFQLQDDILGVTGDEVRLGKAVGSDLREGKVTTLVLHALRAADDGQRTAIRRALGRRQASATQVEAAARCLVELGSVEYTRELAVSYVAQAVELLRRAVPASPVRDLLEALARSMVDRTS